MKYLVYILLFINLCVHSQESRLTVLADGEKITYNLKRCYKSGKLIRMPNGRRFKVVIWGSYAYWDKTKHLIIRSLDGRYSTSVELKDLLQNVEINFNK